MDMGGSIFLLVAAPFVGSFLGVLVERLPVGRPVVMGRSHCDACGHALGPLELLPVVSWLLSRRRCRHCGARLSLFYPMIELAASLVAAWALVVVPWPPAAAPAGLGWVLLALPEIALRHLILPDVLTLPLMLAGLVLAAFTPQMQLADHLVGAVAGFLVLWLVATLYRRLRGREGLGLGDAKLFAAAGAWVGWQGLASVLLIGAVGGLLWAIAAVAVGRGRAPHEPLGFGPFLAAGLWLTWLYGPLGLS